MPQDPQETRPGELTRSSKPREYFTVNLPTSVFWLMVMSAATLGTTIVVQTREQASNQERISTSMMQMSARMDSLSEEVWKLRGEIAVIKSRVEVAERSR